MPNDENPFQRQGFMRSGLEREERGERRGRSPTRRFFGFMPSSIFPTMGDVHSQTVFTHELQTHDQSEDYGASSGSSVILKGLLMSPILQHKRTEFQESLWLLMPTINVTGVGMGVGVVLVVPEVVSNVQQMAQPGKCLNTMVHPT